MVQDGYVVVNGGAATFKPLGRGIKAKLYVDESTIENDGKHIVVTDGPNTGRVIHPYTRTDVEFGSDPIRLEIVTVGHKPTIITSWAVPKWSSFAVDSNRPFSRLQDSVSDLLRELSVGKVNIKYIKADGSVRNAIGTTSTKLIPRYQQYKHGKFEEKSRLLFYYDLQKNDWRCFRIDSLESFSR